MINQYFLIRQSFIFSAFLCLLAYSASAIRFLDFSEYDISSRGKGLRLVDFDTEKQKLIAVHYYKYPKLQKEEKIKVQYEGFNIQLKSQKNGKVNIWSKSNVFDTMAVSISNTFGSSFVKANPKPIEEEGIRTDYRVFWKNRGNKWIEWGETILKALNELNHHPAGEDFEVKFFQDSTEWTPIPKKFTQIVEDSRKANNKERGDLGELVTTLTMTWFGYKQYPSKHGGEVGKGFDGVFRDDSATPELFLTESKNRNESCSVEKYMKEELSEFRILKLLEDLKYYGDEDEKETATKVETCIKKNPERLFKLVQRLLPSGLVHSLVKAFNIESYLLAEAYEPSEDLVAIGSLVKAYQPRYEASVPIEEFIDALMSHYDLSKQEMLKIFQDKLG